MSCSESLHGVAGRDTCDTGGMSCSGIENGAFRFRSNTELIPERSDLDSILKSTISRNILDIRHDIFKDLDELLNYTEGFFRENFTPKEAEQMLAYQCKRILRNLRLISDLNNERAKKTKKKSRKKNKKSRVFQLV